MKSLKKRLNSSSIKDVSVQGGVRGLQGPCDAACEQSCRSTAEAYCPLQCIDLGDYSGHFGINYYWFAVGALSRIMEQC